MEAPAHAIPSRRRSIPGRVGEFQQKVVMGVQARQGLTCGLLLGGLLVGAFALTEQVAVEGHAHQEDPCMIRAMHGQHTVARRRLEAGLRITSYNVCYTKLLRELAEADPEPRQAGLDLLVAFTVLQQGGQDIRGA